MLGPLPKLYRVVVALAALLVCAAAGAWAAFMLPYALLVEAGAGVGLAVGAACAYLLLHQSRTAAPQRVRRRRLY